MDLADEMKDAADFESGERVRRLLRDGAAEIERLRAALAIAVRACPTGYLDWEAGQEGMDYRDIEALAAAGEGNDG